MIHSMNFFVCYRDTDAGGIMYHASYLDIFERARMELLKSLDLLPSKMLARGYLLIIAGLNISYKRPLALEDEVLINTEIASITKSRIIIHQWITKDTRPVTDMMVEMAVVDTSMKAINIPEDLKTMLSQYLN